MLLTWFMSILIFWGFFLACVVYLEIWACLYLMEEDDQSTLGKDKSWGALCQKAGQGCIHTKRYCYMGKRTHFKRLDERKLTTLASRVLPSPTPYLWLAGQDWNPCFNQTPPRQVHTLDEALGNTY